MTKNTKISLEKSIMQLQEIIATLENGNLSLDKALAEFEKGIKLTKSCRDYITTAEQKIQILLEKTAYKLWKILQIMQNLTIPTNNLDEFTAFSNKQKLYFNHLLKNTLQDLSNAQAWPEVLTSSILYSTTNGGKRLRPLLVYIIAKSLNLKANNQLDALALAIELIHCYSLVHDDLPAMDNDDLRRNLPTCHKKFNEATAILTGDVLQSLAFEILAKNNLPNIIISQFAQAIGASGMAGGQILDLAAENQPNLDLEALTRLHLLKTGNLFKSCVILPALLFNKYHNIKLELLENLACNLGIAFQIQDDILEATTDSKILGKSNQSDLQNNKSTFVSILGLAQAKKSLEQYIHNTVTIANQLPEKFWLINFIKFLLTRMF